MLVVSGVSRASSVDSHAFTAGAVYSTDTLQHVVSRNSTHAFTEGAVGSTDTLRYDHEIALRISYSERFNSQLTYVYSM